MRDTDTLIRSMVVTKWNDWYEDRLSELHHELHVRMSLAQAAIRKRDIELGRAEHRIKELEARITELEHTI